MLSRRSVATVVTMPRGKSMTLDSIGRACAVVLAAALAAAALASAQTPPWTAPADDKARKSPLAASPKAVEDGKKIAQINCASCHGAGGKGDGAAAAALNPKPADWTSSRVQDESDGELFWKISTGRGAMPPWKHLAENERWSVIQYIRSLKK
jgi:mono/diheme cytochrome c family protein